MSTPQRPPDRRNLRVAFPIYCSGSAIPACILAVCDRLQGAPFGVEYWAPAVEPSVQRPYHRVPLPRLATRLWYRLGLAETGLRELLERRYLKIVRPGDIAYLWPALSLDFFERLAERGIPIVLERVNSHRRNSMRVLDDAYRRLGLPANHGITMRDADIESRKLALATRVSARARWCIARCSIRACPSTSCSIPPTPGIRATSASSAARAARATCPCSCS